jgi:hypothetical protein
MASTAPTNTTNEIKLTSVLYNGVDITLPIWRNPLNFDPIFSASVSSLPPVIGSPHRFATTVTGTHPTLVPTTMTTLEI